MKPIRLVACTALALAIAACVPQPKPSPPPQQARPAPAPVVTPSPSPMASEWIDRPASPGDWSYRDEGTRSLALFGERETEAQFVLRCERATRAITLSRASDSDAPVAMRIRAETAERVVTARPDGGDLPFVAASLSANDRLLDAMALSKGRFAVEVAGAQPLYLPSWAEVTRVIEDCR